MQKWPAVSGNSINGVGEVAARRPSPIYWHAPDSTPHGPLQLFFYARSTDAVKAARAERQRVLDEPLAPLAEVAVEMSAEAWTVEMKRTARELGAEAVGITRMRPDWVFDGMEPPQQRWMVVLGIKMSYALIDTAPSEAALVEVQRQYTRGVHTAKQLASWLRVRGHDAFPYGGPMAGSFVLIPAAIEAGLGELGKHGSLINPELGANFRLACILTDVPLVADRPVKSGIDDFCASCRLCTDACPPDAIVPDKQLVRGERRWYVDFDKCLPYFNENMGCGICLTVCPFSRPKIGERLVEKLARRRATRTPPRP
jgi:formate hydrogenlyase subunit 6/NADH:ubiquinone oxidoreductase subunit I